MTPLERLIDESHERHLGVFWYAQAAFEKKARAEIKAMAESARRSLGQRFRYTAAGLAAKHGGKT